MGNDSEYERRNRVMQIYDDFSSWIDTALIGQKNVKKVVTSSLLCSTNSRILLTGCTGVGKSTLSDFLADHIVNTERIFVVSDLLPSDIQNQLIDAKGMQLLQVEELNRANGRMQSVFIELFAKNQMKVGKQIHTFDDFYVLATQNDIEMAGIFTVPLALYDRFDVSLSFDDLTEKEEREILFGRKMECENNGHEKYKIFPWEEVKEVKKAVDDFRMDKIDEDIMMEIFEKIGNMTFNGKKLFTGPNIRAKQFALQLVKLACLSKGRLEILPTDILDFIEPLFMHRINQNVVQMGDRDVKDLFESVKVDIKKMKRPKYR